LTVRQIVRRPFPSVLLQSLLSSLCSLLSFAVVTSSLIHFILSLSCFLSFAMVQRGRLIPGLSLTDDSGGESHRLTERWWVQNCSGSIRPNRVKAPGPFQQSITFHGSGLEVRLHAIQEREICSTADQIGEAARQDQVSKLSGNEEDITIAHFRALCTRLSQLDLDCKESGRW
jgi:hypothetical protein